MFDADTTGTLTLIKGVRRARVPAVPEEKNQYFDSLLI